MLKKTKKNKQLKIKLKAVDMELAGWEFVMTNNFQETVFNAFQIFWQFIPRCSVNTFCGKNNFVTE